MNKVFLTGSNGFLGRRLAAELIAAGHDLLSPPREVLYREQDLRKVIMAYQPDFIYSCHSYGNLHSHTGLKDVFEANVLSNFNLFEAAKDTPYQKIFYLSSSSATLPVQTLYSSCKKATESLSKAYRDVIIVRPYSATGVGEQPEHLIPTLIDAAFTGKTVDLDPTPRHDFIDVADVVESLQLLMVDSDPRKIYKLGRGKSYSNVMVKMLVEAATGKDINTNTVKGLRKYDSVQWRSPEQWGHKSLQQSIKEMVDDYNTHMAGLPG